MEGGLSDRRAYTSVMSLLAVMHEKGLVRRNQGEASVSLLTGGAPRSTPRTGHARRAGECV